MHKRVDAKGLACPQPVILTKKALEEMETGKVITIVDNEVAKNNVVKLGRSLKCDVKVEATEGEYQIHLTKGEVEANEAKAVESTPTSSLVYLISSDEFGKGSEELGKVLMKSFLYSLLELNQLPSSIIFVNSGVKLTTQGSEVIETLKALENKGVEILSCGTCLDYYELKDKLLVGEITNMYTIVELLSQGEKTVTL